MTDPWTLVRFLHVLGATLWVGGQLVVSFVVLPLARRQLGGADRAAVMTAVGRRFGTLTTSVFLPVQITTGIVLAWRAGVTWQSLLHVEYAYERILAGKLVVFALVMISATLHGWARLNGWAGLARAMALSSVAGSVAVVLLATALVGG